MLVLQKELAALVKKLSLSAKHHVQLAEVRINYQWLLISLIFGSFQRYIKLMVFTIPFDDLFCR